MWRRICLVVIVLAVAWSVQRTFFASKVTGAWGADFPPPTVTLDQRVATVRHVAPGSPAASVGIVPGDRMRALVAHAFDFLFPAPGQRVAFEITHGSSRRVVTLTAATRVATEGRLTAAILFALVLTELGLAFLLTWRRWDDRDARPLILFFVCHASTMAAGAFPYSGMFALPAFELVNFLAPAGLLRFTAIYPSNVPATGLRRALAIAMPALAVAASIIFPLWAIGVNWFNVAIFPYAVYRYAQLAMYDLLPIAGLVTGLLAASGANRKRLAFLLGFFLAGTSGPIAYSLLLATLGPQHSESLRPLLGTLIITAIGFVYLIFRERLFDVSFVLNRAAVYAAVSTALLPLLLLGEWFAQRMLAGDDRTENALVQIGIALLLFIGARQLYERIDRTVDRLLFRERHENESALRAFARRVILLDDARAIGKQSNDTICAHTDATYVAAYRRNPDGDFSLLAHRGDGAPPLSIDRNDPIVLALRAEGAVVEHLRASAFADALFFPVVGARGLSEFLVCGPKRNGETFAPDERDALLQLARGVAVALDAVHISDLERENAVLRLAPQPAGRNIGAIN
jgi:hypothetical protein